MTAIDVTARYAVVLNNAGTASKIDSEMHIQIELVGVPVRALTLAHIVEPGSASSRENAYVIRELAVTDAIPQKNCATTTMKSRNFAIVGLPNASRNTCAGGSPVPEAASAVSPASLLSWMDAVIEYSRMNPPMTDTNTLSTMPRGALSAAPLVSSATCAEAS